MWAMIVWFGYAPFTVGKSPYANRPAVLHIPPRQLNLRGYKQDVRVENESVRYIIWRTELRACGR